MVLVRDGTAASKCLDFAAMAISRLFQCTVALASFAREQCCPAIIDMATGACSTCQLCGCETRIDNWLLYVGVGATVMWLILPRDLWEGWLCGYSMLNVGLLALALWRVARELRLRQTLEESVQKLSEENTQLRSSTEQLGADLTMLQDTVGALGNKGDDWLGQLRFLYFAKKRGDQHYLEPQSL